MNAIEPGDLVIAEQRVMFVTDAYTLKGVACVEVVFAEDETCEDNWLKPMLYRKSEILKIVCVDDF